MFLSISNRLLDTIKKRNSPVLYRGRAGRNTWPSLMAADAKIAVAIVEAVIVVVIIEPAAKTRRTNEPPTQTQTAHKSVS